MKTKKIILVGAGYTADELLPIILNNQDNVSYKIVGILDDNKNLFKKNYQGIPIHVGLENAKKFLDCRFVFGIGSYKNKNQREKIFKKMELTKDFFPNIVHSSVIIENNVKMGFGNIVYPNTSICSDTKIEDFTMLTYSCIVAHKVRIGSFSLFGSRSSILNNVKIGKNVFCGANVLFAENIEIGNMSSIIFGSNVLTNVPSKKTAYGNPAKILDYV